MENEVKKVMCPGCEEQVDSLENCYGKPLCEECNDIYEDATGFCSLNCCLGGGCDGSC